VPYRNTEIALWGQYKVDLLDEKAKGGLVGSPKALISAIE